MAGSSQPEGSAGGGEEDFPAVEVSFEALHGDELAAHATNLGEDTDTTGCVTGALAGCLWGGIEGIPETWALQVARRLDIAVLARRAIER